MTAILMVCMGNICRSPMAETVAQRLFNATKDGLQFKFDSAGTHADRHGIRMDTRARTSLIGRGYAPGSTRSRKVTVADFSYFDLILAMDNANLTELRNLCPSQHRYKLRLFLEFALESTVREVPDPYYGNQTGFEYVLDLCEIGVKALIRTQTETFSLTSAPVEK